ncbi:YheC/YheD family endospore coat-associated protein [Longirhabdus pacifica]|uniref:YheC/YheD family endospore coat-associated protein n=1 Tax=Longirhabdus pacifica TaxID=2305227 RepID=UPI001008F5C3|nr:YheC/YheD family protein [Longirhabdus pacifica]
MSKKIYTLHTKKHLSENEIMVHPAIFNDQVPTFVQLHIASWNKELSIVKSPNENTVGISHTLANSIGLYDGAHVKIYYQPSTESLHIGPLLAVTLTINLNNPEVRDEGNLSSFCKEIATQMQQQGGIVYFITPTDIYKRDETCMTGWRYTNTWKKQKFITPKLIYNRIGSRKQESRLSVQHFFKEVKSYPDGFIFNEKFMNKSKSTAMLLENEEIRKFIPETMQYKKLSTLQYMCGKYTTVFVKPVYGSMGKGIIRIQKLQNGSYTMEETQPSKVMKKKYKTLSSLHAFIAKKIRSTSFQIQQGITLTHIQNNALDYRVQAQKDGKGEWCIASIVARISPRGQIVSNLARGGQMIPFKKSLTQSNLPNAHIRATQTKIKRAAILIAQSIDDQTEDHFAEFGIDLGIDKKGNVWLIEVNTKPSKKRNIPFHKNKIRPSVKKMIEYVHYLFEE